MGERYKMIKNNTSGKFSNFRDSFLDSLDKSCLQTLTQNEKFQSLVSEMQSNYKVEELYKMARKTMKQIETGKCKNKEELDRAQDVMLVCLFAIVDYEQEKFIEVTSDKIEIVK